MNMNVDTQKIELIDWITHLNDQHVINKVLSLKKKLSSQQEKRNTKVFGSGKHLIEYIADDFDEPLELFDAYKQ